jgi:hypothetical protein
MFFLKEFQYYFQEYFQYYLIIKVVMILSVVNTNPILSFIKRACYGGLWFPFFAKHYIQTWYKFLYNKFFVCGIKRISPNSVVHVVLYKGRIIRFPMEYIENKRQRIVTSIKVRVKSSDSYIETDYYKSYVESFLELRYLNIRVTPRLMGLYQIKITTLNDECEEIEKEYDVNENVDDL